MSLESLLELHLPIEKWKQIDSQSESFGSSKSISLVVGSSASEVRLLSHVVV